jgi:RING-box protein 1
MADIDMTDAPSGSGSGSAGVKKSLGKAKAAAGEGGADGKKRFEVKKVGQYVPVGWRLPED